MQNNCKIIEIGTFYEKLRPPPWIFIIPKLKLGLFWRKKFNPPPIREFSPNFSVFFMMAPLSFVLEYWNNKFNLLMKVSMINIFFPFSYYSWTLELYGNTHVILLGLSKLPIQSGSGTCRSLFCAAVWIKLPALPKFLNKPVSPARSS